MDIGVVDSVYDPGELKDYNRFGRSFDVIDAGVGSTCPHGYAVLDILTTYTYNPQFHLFQAIGANGRSRDSYLMKAIGLAKEYGEVDILNLSVGADHISDPDRDCTESRTACALCDVVEDAVESGITMVCSSGNRPHVDKLCCPSLSSYTISVGGAVTTCGYTSPAPAGALDTGEELPPPNATWIIRSDDKGSQEVLCSERGCLPGESCAENRATVPWEDNVDFTDRKPDILAPTHWVTGDGNGPILSDGTSYATPVVCAGISCLMEGERTLDHSPTPDEIRNAIKSSGIEFPGIDRAHFSLQSLYNTYRSMTGRTTINFEQDNGPFDLLY